MPSVQRFLTSGSAKKGRQGSTEDLDNCRILSRASREHKADVESLLLPGDLHDGSEQAVDSQQVRADSFSRNDSAASGGGSEGGVPVLVMAASVGSGIFLGAQGVPLSNDKGYPLRDAATFMMLQLAWTLTICAPTLWYRHKQRQQRANAKETVAGPGEEQDEDADGAWNWHFRVAAAPAMVGGLCFSFAFLGQLYAILALTDSVGLPLSQLNLVVAGVLMFLLC
jgi:hypothetical protein